MTLPQAPLSRTFPALTCPPGLALRPAPGLAPGSPWPGTLQRIGRPLFLDHD